MSKHTPGPWTVENPMEFELSIVEANKETYEWRFIASCTLPEPDDEETHDFTIDEVEANARLIAAAPALLEACELTLSNLDHLTDVWGQEGVTRTVQDKLRAAIAAAKGGPQ